MKTLRLQAHIGRHRLSGVLIALLLLTPGCLQAAKGESTEEPEVVVLAGQAMLVPGRPIAQNVDIHVRSGRITYIAASSTRPSAAQVVDLSCCFVVPGLIDTQTHLQSQRDMPPRAERMTTFSDADYVLWAMVHARRTLEAGFTTVRDMGSHGDAMYALRDAVNAGRVPGPRIQVAGEVIHSSLIGTRPVFRPELEPVFETPARCDGADDCRRAVRELVALGSDTIKVETKLDLTPDSAAHFTMDELRAMADEAQRLGVRITASSFSAASMNEPLSAGFDAVVHGTFADEETLALLRSTSAWFIPTLVAARTVREMALDPATPVDQAWREENLLIYEGMIRSFRMVLEAGLPIAFGTDAGWRPHGGNAEQLVQMVELGMPASEVIAAATRNAAEAIGWQRDVGTLEVGKYADLVATAADPIADISELTRPVLVMKGGQVVMRRD